MANIVGVTSYLGRRVSRRGRRPRARDHERLRATRDGKNFYTDSEGCVWRVYPFIEGTVCLQNAETPSSLRRPHAPSARFQRDAQRLPGGHAL